MDWASHRSLLQVADRRTSEGNINLPGVKPCMRLRVPPNSGGYKRSLRYKILRVAEKAAAADHLPPIKLEAIEIELHGTEGAVSLSMVLENRVKFQSI